MADNQSSVGASAECSSTSVTSRSIGAEHTMLYSSLVDSLLLCYLSAGIGFAN